MDIKTEISEMGNGAVNLFEGDEKVGEMIVERSGDTLRVFHTEVFTEAHGKGLGKKLLNGLAFYARTNHMKIIPYCPFVLSQFKRHTNDYADVWLHGDFEANH